MSIMASQRPQYNFVPDSRDLEALEEYQQEHDATKAEAARHYVSAGIEAQIEARRQGEDDSARDWPLLNVVAVQFAVMGVFVLMLGPGLGVIGPTAALYTSLGLIFIAFWIIVLTRTSLFDGWIARLQDYHDRISDEQVETVTSAGTGSGESETEIHSKSHGD